ncbi:MAG: M23 family metallopeptidase [Calditrichia bacterium]
MLNKYLVGFVLVLFLQQGGLTNNCKDGDVCIFVEKKFERIDVYVKNDKAVDVTMTIDVFRDNLFPTKQLPLTDTFRGKTTTLAFRLHVDDPQIKWKYQYKWSWTRGNIYAEHDNSYVYRLPYAKGQAARVLQGYHGSLSHSGDDTYTIDFDLAVGSSIFAARDGVVVDVKENSNSGGDSRDFVMKGNYIVIKHIDNTIAEYFHLMHNGAAVEVGQIVKRGQHIGYSGNTGFSNTPHLHFGVYKSVDGDKRESIPVRFKTSQSIMRNPVVGYYYIAE